MHQERLLLGKEQHKDISVKKLLNLNLGVLGHVDSGKTSLCQTLTQVQSTACLDKSPQSQERGITLDLGFSALYAKKPKAWVCPQQFVQITLVDCPGHASLIRTVVGGAQIIDTVILVVDINKGIQTQTAQCLAVAQLLVSRLIVVLNKCDLLVEENRTQAIAKRIASLKKILLKTKFGDQVKVVPFVAVQKDPQRNNFQIQTLVNVILGEADLPRRDYSGPALVLSDHYFLLKGKGAVFTGTVIQGRIRAGEQLELPQFAQKRRVKSLQVFHKDVAQVGQGDRVAILTAVLQGQKPQRTLLCSPGYVRQMRSAVISLNKVEYFKYPIRSKGLYHVTCGHLTVMAQLRLFEIQLSQARAHQLSLLREKRRVFRKHAEEEVKEADLFGFQPAAEYEAVNDYAERNCARHLFARLSFQKPILGNEGSLLIGAKFDLDESANVCRLAFSGHVLRIEDEKSTLLIFRWKVREGVVDRLVDQRTVIVKDLFPKQADLNFMTKKELQCPDGSKLEVLGPFGKSNKLKCMAKGGALSVKEQQKVSYRYKKYYK